MCVRSQRGSWCLGSHPGQAPAPPLPSHILGVGRGIGAEIWDTYPQHCSQIASDCCAGTGSAFLQPAGLHFAVFGFFFLMMEVASCLPK